MHQLPLLVFTDLDGTLLDHHSYSCDAALPALARLREMSAGVVLASSKTAAEIAPLRAELGLADWPAIVENGAGILAARQEAEGGDDIYQQLRAVLDKVPPSLRAGFRGFGDMDTAQVVQATGLAPAQAALARQRRFSEPGLWQGSDDECHRFIAALADAGVSARRGGRFLTLSYGQTKADRMAEIIADLAPRQTIALGDAPNDVEMIETADFGFIVTNPDAPPLPELPGEKAGRIRRTLLSGPAGWNAAILGLVSSHAIIREN